MSLSSIRTLSAALAIVSGLAQAAALPPIPDKPAAEQFKDVPAPWRDYLIQARAAERLADPLQRCLAFPDLPGNAWPAGHTEAHCRDHAAELAMPAEVSPYLQRGDFAGLETRLDALLQRHFAETGVGEDIHYAFSLFEEGVDPHADAWSAAWLAQRPQSAYAHLARATFYRGQAWAARGNNYASKTPRENLRRMSAFVGQAVPLYEEAIRLNPRLMPAYDGLLEVAMADSRDDEERRAIAGAQAVDPACVTMARKRMQALEPRWGGSYDAMLSYANELGGRVAGRPQLANVVAAPFADRGDRLVDAEQYTRDTADTLEVALRKSSNEDALQRAAEVAFNLSDAPREPWKGVAYLLQRSRFEALDDWGDRNVARMLVRIEPEWSLVYATRFVALKPDSGYGHYLLGAGYNNSRRFDDAEREYLIAANDADQRKYALGELGGMWLFGDQTLPAKTRVAKAKPAVDRLLAAYPELGAAWYLRVMEGLIAERRIDMDSVAARNFLKYYDRNNARQTLAAQRMQGIVPAAPDAPKPKGR